MNPAAVPVVFPLWLLDSANLARDRRTRQRRVVGLRISCSASELPRRREITVP
jgi:hypothetical protein